MEPSVQIHAEMKVYSYFLQSNHAVHKYFSSNFVHPKFQTLSK